MTPNEDVPNSYDKTDNIQTEADSVTGAIRHHGPNIITPLIRKPVSNHSSGKKETRLHNFDSIEIETTPTAGRKRKMFVLRGTSSLGDNEGGDIKFEQSSRGYLC